MTEPYCRKCKKFLSLREGVAGECAVCFSAIEFQEVRKTKKPAKKKSNHA
jgi:hypothetical protein